MDTVVLDGVTYLKASAAAKQFRYTTDYIGQLCRGKKVDARLVGRTWFVNPESLTAHKRGRHQKKHKGNEPVTALDSAPAEGSEVAHPVRSRKIVVAPRLKTATLKQLSEQAARLSGERKLHVFYEADDEQLLPTLHKPKTRPPRTILIEPAEAKKVRIAGTKQATDFTATEIPDIALSGKLTVQEHEEADEVTTDAEAAVRSVTVGVTEQAESDNNERNSKQNKDISDKRADVAKAGRMAKTTAAVPLTAEVVTSATPVQASATTLEMAPKAKSKPADAADPHKVTTELPASTLSVVAVDQAVGDASTATPTPNSFIPVSIQARSAQTPALAVLISPLIATALAVVVVLLLFSASATVVVTGERYDATIVLQVANLLETFTN